MKTNGSNLGDISWENFDQKVTFPRFFFQYLNDWIINTEFMIHQKALIKPTSSQNSGNMLSRFWVSPRFHALFQDGCPKWKEFLGEPEPKSSC